LRFDGTSRLPFLKTNHRFFNMYQYTAFDQSFVKLRAAQFRDQLDRHLSGRLPEDEFRPLRLQNGWYVQRYAPMLRVAVPYGELSSAQMRVLAQIASEFDQPEAGVYERAQTTQDLLPGSRSRGDVAAKPAPRLARGYGHFTTRQNIQYNWIPLAKSADVMDLLASVHMHGIQTSGNCIRNITSDERAGIAVDELADPRPYCELLRQWSTLHPEFAFLPRKFKIAVSGAVEDRAAIAWHDVGLHLRKNEAGDIGFKVLVGGGMGRTPVIGSTIREFLPWQEILNYLEAVIRVYNQFGRRDNIYKARIKILVKAEGQKYIDAVEAEYQAILSQDGGRHTLTQAELARVSASFVAPQVAQQPGAGPGAHHTPALSDADLLAQAAGVLSEKDFAAFSRWFKQSVQPHQAPHLRAVSLSLKRLGQAPGDATPEQLLAAADLAERFSAAELRVTHKQNLLLPWVKGSDLVALWQAAKLSAYASPNLHLLTDMIACPGGDFCALANARSIPIAEQIAERYQDLDELDDLGVIDLHISGCINSCGHHHSGHIGVLGVDKDGKEWYQVTLGGSDGSDLSGAPTAGKVVGPSFSADEVVEVIEAVLGEYKTQRLSGEAFIHTLKRVGLDPFKTAANGARWP
jgi:sulfite reductase (NADPH) hemoprotein beta-component